MFTPQRQHLLRSLRFIGLNQRVDITQPVLLLLRPGFECCGKIRQPGTGLLCLHGQNAQTVVGLRVIRLALQDAYARDCGLPEDMIAMLSALDAQCEPPTSH